MKWLINKFGVILLAAVQMLWVELRFYYSHKS